MSLHRVQSKDVTTIAYERKGSGAAVVLVGGGLDDGSENASLAIELSNHFSVYNYARRDRGRSGNTLPYSLEREIEDLEALTIEAGGSAHLYGVSSGGALVLEAVAAGVAADRIAAYEVPYSVGDEAARAWRRYVDQLTELLGEGRRGDALSLFMQLAGSSADDIEEASGHQSGPTWRLSRTPLLMTRPVWEMALHLANDSRKSNGRL